MKKSDFDVEIDDLIFQEEVKDEELYSKRDVNDVIYNDSEIRRKRTKFLIILAVVLIIISIISAIMGFVYLDKDLKQKNNNVVVQKYDLFVTHSNSSYGGEIASFDDHRKLDDAYSYKFTISNDNPIVLKYSVEFINSNYGNDNIDMTLINYKLLKNGEVVSDGFLSNMMINELYSTDILSNSTDEYVIQVWSLKLAKNLKFNFKINVKV